MDIAADRSFLALNAGVGASAGLAYYLIADNPKPTLAQSVLVLVGTTVLASTAVIVHELGHIVAAIVVGARGPFAISLSASGGLSEFGSLDGVPASKFRWVALAGYTAEAAFAVLVVTAFLSVGFPRACWFLLVPWALITAMTFRSYPNDIDFFRQFTELAREEDHDP